VISKQTLTNKDLLLHPYTDGCFLDPAATEREHKLYQAMWLLPGELLKYSSTLGCRCFAEGQFTVQQETANRKVSDALETSVQYQNNPSLC